MPDKPKPEGHPEPAPPQYREARPPPDWAAGYDSEKRRGESRPCRRRRARTNARFRRRGDQLRRGGRRRRREEAAQPDRRDQGRRAVPEAHQGHHPPRRHRRADQREVQQAGDRLVRARLPARQGAAQAHREASSIRTWPTSSRPQLLLAEPGAAGRGAQDQPASPSPTSTRTRSSCPRRPASIYEFEVEVAPEFELPQLQGPQAQTADPGDSPTPTSPRQRLGISAVSASWCPRTAPPSSATTSVVDVEVAVPGKEPTAAKDMLRAAGAAVGLQGRRRPRLRRQAQGRQAGRESRASTSPSPPTPATSNLRGQSVQATFRIQGSQDSSGCRSWTHEFLDKLGVHTPDQLREKVRIASSASCDTSSASRPASRCSSRSRRRRTGTCRATCCIRQARKTLATQTDGNAIGGHVRRRGSAPVIAVLQQDAMATTARSLKEHFVLQKIAEVEKIEVDDDDIEYEIETHRRPDRRDRLAGCGPGWKQRPVDGNPG